MSELGKALYDKWEREGRHIGKMEYIHKAIKEFKITHPLTKKIYRKFGAEIFRRSIVPLCYGDVALERYMKGKTIKCALEIGTWNGIPSAIMAQYADKVITIDIKDEQSKYKLWNYLGINNKIEFHLVKNETEKEKLIKTLDFDYCYMDGNHQNYTYSDWMMVRHCGRVLFHEYWTKQKPVKDLVKSLPKDEVTLFTRLKGGDVTYEPFAYWEKK